MAEFLAVYDVIAKGGVQLAIGGLVYLLYTRKLAFYWQVEEIEERVEEERARTAEAREEMLYWRSLALSGTGLLANIAERSSGKGGSG